MPTPAQQSSGPGILAWGLGLLFLACVPFVSSIAASVAMAVAGSSARRTSSGAIAENGRYAANWGLTYLVLTIVLVGGHFGLLFAFGEVENFFPFGLIFLSWVLVSLVHVIISIVGMIRASNQRVLRAWAIPFFR